MCSCLCTPACTCTCLNLNVFQTIEYLCTVKPQLSELRLIRSLDYSIFDCQQNLSNSKLSRTCAEYESIEKPLAGELLAAKHNVCFCALVEWLLQQHWCWWIADHGASSTADLLGKGSAGSCMHVHHQMRLHVM